MGLNYDKYKHEEESQGSFWTSYSDLFMILAVVFLLLYVVTSLRSTASSVVSHISYKKLEEENKSLKSQLRAYQILKDDYLEKKASDGEREKYSKLMDQLELLRDKTDQENKKLLAQMDQNKKRKNALNEYQKVIKSIIEANFVSKSRVKRRDDLIGQQSGELNRQLTMLQKKKEIIESKEEGIVNLQYEIQEKEKNIKDNKAKISAYETSLKDQIEKVKTLTKKGELTKKEMAEQIAQLERDNKKAIKSLISDSKNEQIILKEKIAALDTEKKQQKKLYEDLSSQKNLLEKEFSKAQGQFKLAESRFLEKVKAQKEEFSKIKTGLEKEKADLASKNTSLGSRVEKLKTVLGAKKRFAKQLKKSFQEKGIAASVNSETGDVEINFGKEYFDLGKSRLKKGMKEIVKRVIPEYASVLFKDKEISKKVKAVEIIGFASPTYQGRMINPKSLSPQDRNAVNYNLDLSYFRARSIFKYIFDKDEISFPEQKKLLSYIKVSGRSFFTEKVNGRHIASESMYEYCAVHDCNKSQKVIIKFSME